ncbi:MAG: hypothetical protein UT30_C0004G0015 [Candidatus Uhrbacteria bacterium GW2011_GWF2_39_13]|uniref:Glycoside hydrolase family 42 N-terminal domain-containing protein n=1 Tax=Candidatus Uhrbacteria bacterium GW2011_GWF2_39_13 TaxID=1618995 RepID=A0A0G0QSX9_9BACT|nr:MAG: hypothetical protein UT30_C0004G0015 [Candidatus Uhrbacteria bacterium GW2011_GWF2_39_13]
MRKLKSILGPCLFFSLLPIFASLNSQTEIAESMNWKMPAAGNESPDNLFHGGKIKILFIGTWEGQIESIKLAEKLRALEIATHMTYSNKELGSEKFTGAAIFDPVETKRELSGKLDKNWDLIVVGKIDWAAFPKELQLKILKKVHSGTGLLYIGIHNGDRFIKRIKTEKSIPIEDTIKASIILDKKFKETYSLPETKIVCAKLGKGKICFVDYTGELHNGSIQMLTPTRYIYDTPFIYDCYLDFLNKCAMWVTNRLDVKTEDANAHFNMDEASPADIELQPDKFSFLPKEAITGKLLLKSPKTNISVVLELYDNLNRLIEKKEVHVSGDTLSFKFAPVAPLVPLHYICAQIISNGTVVSEARKPIAVKTEAAADFVLAVWVTHPVNLPVGKNLLKSLKSYGVDVIYSYNMPAKNDIQLSSEGKAIAEANLLSMPYALRIFFSDSPVNMTRKPCLNDPEYRKSIKYIFKRQEKSFWPYFPFYYSLGDENALSAYNNADICCSEFCNKDFIKFLQGKFKTLNDLNTCWHKNYKSWDEVKPILLTDAKKDKYLIPWFYHRMHMDKVYTDIHDFCKGEIRNFDPDAKVGFEGFLCGSTWGGGDYTQLFKQLDFFVPYASVTDNEIMRSFCSPAKSYGTICGAYSATMSNPKRSSYAAWDTLFSGGNLIVWWQASGYFFENGKIIGPGLKPDLTAYSWFNLLCDEVNEIKMGAATVLENSHSVNSGTAILYNRLAYYAATANDRTLHLNSFVKLLKDSSLRADILCFEDILDSSFTPEKYPLLILPGCEYLPKSVAEKISVYMNLGGKIICDIYPSTDMNGNSLDIDKSKMLMFNPENLEKYNGDWGMGEVKNFPWTENGAIIRKNFQKLLASIDKVKAPVELSDTSGNDPFDCNAREWSNGTEKYLAIQRYPYPDSPETKNIKVKLRKPVFVYDIRKRKLLGFRDTINLNIQQGDSFLFALLNRKHLDFNISVTNGTLKISASEKPDEKLFFKIDIFSPDGKKISYYSGNAVITDGVGEYHIKYALNDAPGEWTAKITDIVTGVCKTLKYTR